MRLCEHDAFEQALLQTAEAYNLSEQFVEKDYYVTEILRIVVDDLGDRAIFKGGTSLSKGWGLIKRFSEDVDLLLDRTRQPPLSKNAVDRRLKRLAESVSKHPALNWRREESRTIGGLGREDHFAYESRFDALTGVRATVRLEPGVQSGNFPTEKMPIGSLVGQYLSEQGSASIADDLDAFEMTLLHYRRTFVEKMFAIHGKVLRLQNEGVALGRDARHYADLHALAGEQQVHAMLRSREYQEIREDYDRISRRFFAKSYRPPADLSFSDSVALFPPESLRNRIQRDYEEQCQLLFATGEHPSFEQVLAHFQEIRKLL